MCVCVIVCIYFSTSKILQSRNIGICNNVMILGECLLYFRAKINYGYLIFWVTKIAQMRYS